MMDELDLLKKDWQKKEAHLPQLSYNDIYTMIWKKSHSIVKWIVIISVLEFTLPHLLYLLPGTADSLAIYEKLGVKNLSMTLWVIGYGITFYFIFLFYKRYKEISILDSAKDLMKKIIRTRRTVKYYVIYSLSFLLLTCFILFVGMYLNNDLVAVFKTDANDMNISPEKFRSIMLWTMAIFSVLIVLFMGGIYFLLYGLLLRKLNRNYKELKRLEI
jgi:MFS family permease